MTKLELLKLPKGWKLSNIGEVGEIVSGITLGKKIRKATTRSVPYLRVANVKDGYLDLSNVYEIEATEEEIKKWKLKFGDILLTEGGDADKLGRGTFWAGKIHECIHQNHIFRVRFDLNKFSPQFIAAQISSSFCKSYFLAHAKQTTGIATINQQILAACPLIVPPLEEQKRIAAILDKCDRLRRTRRYALQLSDTFLQSVFLEMFGNFLQLNTENQFQEVLEIPLSNGVFEKNENYGCGTPVIWVDNLYHTTSIDTSKLRRANLDNKSIQKYEVFEGDLLFTRSSLVREGTGQINIVPKLSERTTFECHTIRARVNKKLVNPYYILGLYRSSYGRNLIMQRANTATMTTIGQEGIEELLCPIPPLPLQEKFAQIVQKFERLRTQQRESDRQAEHLFQTLLHRAFLGELTSSDFNDEAVSVFSQEISVQQPKPKSTVEVAEYLHTKVNQQEAEAVQLTLPGLE